MKVILAEGDKLFCSKTCAGGVGKAATLPIPMHHTWAVVNALLRRATCDRCGKRLLPERTR